MSRRRLTLLTAVLVITAVPSLARAAETQGIVVLDLRSDPLDPAAPSLEIEGPGAAQFVFDPSSAPIHPSDARGTLNVLYDSTLPTTRAVARLASPVSDADDFIFGAILTIRADGFAPDPLGFHPISFSMIDTTSTGFERTGSLSDFRSDAFDTLDVAYFPQAHLFFGGPFLAPAAFGDRIADDAFANFSFGSVPFELHAGVPYLIAAEHLAAEKKLVVTVYAIGPGGLPLALAGGRAEVSTASLTGFHVDALAITPYEDGFNVFSTSGRSLLASVGYDLLFFAPGRLGAGGPLPSLTSILRRSAGNATH